MYTRVLSERDSQPTHSISPEKARQRFNPTEGLVAQLDTTLDTALATPHTSPAPRKLSVTPEKASQRFIPTEGPVTRLDTP